ncbi:MAG: hypothetical protein LBV68_07420 [Spirochaetaceae bacterium]|nr:hypothetical protein [Spirochaetaceae bacterium]
MRFIPFTVRDVGLSEAKLIESLILSYISDIENVVVYMDPDAGEEPITGGFWQEGGDFSGSAEFPVESIKNRTSLPQYILSGSIYVEDENHVLSLDFNHLDRDEFIRKIALYKNTSEMALNVRSIIADYFHQNTQNILTEDESALPLNYLEIIGTWHGGDGIELIRFSPFGRALAYFSSGVTMELSYSVENNTLIVVQQSPNNYRYYYPLPATIAEKLAEKAEPVQWKMFLYNKGKILRGIRISTIVEYDKAHLITNIIFGNIKKEEWTKLSY